MVKIGPKKARVLFKMNGCRPFSYKYGNIGTYVRKMTIFGVIPGEKLSPRPNDIPSVYDTDQIFRECEAEEYYRRVEYKESALRARNLVDGMLRYVLHSEYDTLIPMLAELEYVSERLHQIAQGMVIEPH